MVDQPPGEHRESQEADDDLMGDGVKIAASLEGVSEPGGLCLSGAAYEQVRDRVKETFVDLGEKVLKNIARRVRAYGLSGNSAGPVLEFGSARPALSLPEKPSIAVLPFQNMSGDPEQDYFADGMAEDIITGLSRIEVVVRHRAQFELRLQRQGGRRASGRARAWRSLRP